MSPKAYGRSAGRLPRQLFFKIGFTLILLGYFLVWLPQPVAGLSFIGLEMGEWIKFMPQIRSGQVALDRNLFYLPPITLGLLLALWTSGWPNRRWQTWAVRATAILVAMLAFPAIEAILYEGSDQWLGRVLMIAAVVVTAASIPLLDRLPPRRRFTVVWMVMTVLAIIGMAAPSWAYVMVRPAAAELFANEVGVGPGVWLNGFGHLLIAIVALSFLMDRGQLQAAEPQQ